MGGGPIYNPLTSVSRSEAAGWHPVPCAHLEEQVHVTPRHSQQSSRDLLVFRLNGIVKGALPLLYATTQLMIVNETWVKAERCNGELEEWV